MDPFAPLPCKGIMYVVSVVLQAEMMYTSGVFWMALLLVPVTALLLDVVLTV